MEIAAPRGKTKDGDVARQSSKDGYLFIPSEGRAACMETEARLVDSSYSVLPGNAGGRKRVRTLLKEGWYFGLTFTRPRALSKALITDETLQL